MGEETCRADGLPVKADAEVVIDDSATHHRSVLSAIVQWESTMTPELTRFSAMDPASSGKLGAKALVHDIDAPKRHRELGRVGHLASHSSGL